jgi:hypothetical protein
MKTRLIDLYNYLDKIVDLQRENRQKQLNDENRIRTDSARGQFIDPKICGLESIITHHSYNLVLCQCNISNQYNTTVSDTSPSNDQCRTYTITKIDVSPETEASNSNIKQLRTKLNRCITFKFDSYGSIVSWICTCGLHSTMGIPCRHYFATITTQPQLNRNFNTSSWTRKFIHPFWERKYWRDAIDVPLSQQPDSQCQSIKIRNPPQKGIRGRASKKSAQKKIGNHLNSMLLPPK